MPGAHSVYVVDDNSEMRRSLCVMLTEAGYSVGAFGSGREFLENAHLLEGGIVLLDLRMPCFDGQQTLASIIDRFPKFACVMVTGHGDVESAVEALKSGAKDFLQKPFREEALLAILERELAKLRSSAKLSETAKAARDLVGSLSRREREVFSRMVRGFQNKTIAHELGLSIRTVEMHRARVMQRLRCNTLAAAVNIAIHSGESIDSPSGNS